MNFQVRPNNANIDEVGPLGMIDRHNFTEVSRVTFPWLEKHRTIRKHNFEQGTKCVPSLPNVTPKQNNIHPSKLRLAPTILKAWFTVYTIKVSVITVGILHRYKL